MVKAVCPSVLECMFCRVKGGRVRVFRMLAKVFVY